METNQRHFNRGSVPTGYDIDNSLKLESDNSETLYKANANGNRRTWTTSMWIKRTELSTVDYLILHGVYGYPTGIRFNTDNELELLLSDLTSTEYKWVSNARFRDTSAWYHIVCRVDTTQGTATNRQKVYVNGEEITWSSSATIAQNFDTLANYVQAVYDEVQFSYKEASQYSNMYLAEVHHCDGYSYAPTEFGEFDEDSGIWTPIEADVSYGTNGFYLDFKDSSDLGNDANGGTDLTLSNIAAADQSTDTPTNNFCTWNPLVTNAGVFTYTEGATKWKPSSGNWQTTTASMGFTKGKWYAEFKMDGDVTSAMVGVQQLENDTTYDGYYLGYHADTTSMGMGYYNADGDVYRNGGNTAYGASFPSSVLVGVALEFKDDGTANMYVAKDNVWQNSGDPANGTNGFALNSGNAVDDFGFFSFASSLYQNPGYWQANFGGYTTLSISSAASDANGYGTFEYAPPTGFYALCTKNLSEFGG